MEMDTCAYTDNLNGPPPPLSDTVDMTPLSTRPTLTSALIDVKPTMSANRTVTPSCLQANQQHDIHQQSHTHAFRRVRNSKVAQDGL